MPSRQPTAARESRGTPRPRQLPAALRCLGALALAAVLLGQGSGSHTLRREVGPGRVVALTGDHEIFLEALPLKGEGLLAFARRLSGDEAAAAPIAAANDGAEALSAGIRYRVPYSLLKGELQLEAMRALFADDRPEAEGWRHQVGRLGTLQQESLWRVALWFTGEGQNFRALREHNELPSEDLVAGSSIVIPADLLLPAFRAALPAADGGGEEAAGNGFQLEYSRDEKGEVAVYRLRAGEALYSSVVVRFTGRLFAKDVNALAEEIAQRSGIRDVTDIPVGYAVKIPLDLLLPEHLPPGDPRRQEYEAARQASARFGNRVRSLDLSGITIILDAGHGGRDVGASFGGVWESLYNYDIMLRIRHLLETYTSARVLVTVQDGDRLVPEDRDSLSFSRGHRVLTNPPYAIEDAAVGTNLRWYLANSFHRDEKARGRDGEKVVFLSVHADSLHPSLRGAMVYIPDAQLRAGSFGRSGAVYASRREVRERPRVSFSWQDRVKSEGLSRDLANHVIRAFARRGLPVHPFKPVREKIIRRHRQYVPAVLRYNEVPAKILVEVCNLANDEDRKLLLTRDHRQQMAEAIVEGLLTYYGYDGDELSTRVAAAK